MNDGFHAMETAVILVLIICCVSINLFDKALKHCNVP